MLSIESDVTCELLIKRSKFISFLFRVDCLDDVSVFLNKLDCDYNDATHICYAYVIDNLKKFNDDGEPTGTAGMPILNVLESNNLNHVLCCVVRYFGGIKLGANGLVRAYSSCSSLVVSKASIVCLEFGKLFKFSFKYEFTKKVDSILKKAIVVNRDYDFLVYYLVKVSLSEFNCIYDDLCKFGSILDVNDCYVEKLN